MMLLLRSHAAASQDAAFTAVGNNCIPLGGLISAYNTVTYTITTAITNIFALVSFKSSNDSK